MQACTLLANHLVVGLEEEQGHPALHVLWVVLKRGRNLAKFFPVWIILIKLLD